VFGNHPGVHGLDAFERLRVGRVVHEHHPLHRSIVRIGELPETLPASNFLRRSSGNTKVNRPLWDWRCLGDEGGTQSQSFTALPWIVSILLATSMPMVGT
jgi:hypothetical protein